METWLSFPNNLFISVSAFLLSPLLFVSSPLFCSALLCSPLLSSPLLSPSLILSFSPHLSFCLLPSSPLLLLSPPLPCRPDPACPWPGPKLCPLSLLSHHSSLLPWCRLRPFAAHRKSQHRDGELRPWRDQQLRYSGTRLHLKRRWRRGLVWLRPLCGGPLPHPAVLPLGGGIALQQIWTSPAARRQPAAFTFYRLYSERPQVGWKWCVCVCVWVCGCVGVCVLCAHELVCVCVFLWGSFAHSVPSWSKGCLKALWKDKYDKQSMCWCVRGFNKFGKSAKTHTHINLYCCICEDIALTYIHSLEAYHNLNPDLYIPCSNP